MELPLFYKEKMKQVLKDEYDDYIKSFESEAQSGIRINTLKIKPEEFAEKIEDIKIRGYSEIAVIIGGTDGMSEAVKSKCDLRLSFSRMTFPHPLMRVILLEQFYRALNIGAGGKYHH